MRRKLNILALGLAIAIVLGLFVLGRLPGAGNLFLPPWDKLAHFCVYGVLAICLRLGTGNMPWKYVVLITAAVGLLDEIDQAFIPGRTAAAADFLADLFGSLAGVAAYKVKDAL